MNRNYSTEQLQRNIAHLKLVYQKEKAELEAMEANARSLEEQVEQKTAYNSQLRSRIYDNLSEIMKTSTTCSAMGKLISKASKDIEKELGKVDACDVEMVQLHNEIKAELQKTIDESQEDFISEQIQALQSKKDELEAKLKQREVVLANLIEKNRLTKEQQKRIHEQNFEKTLDLHSKIHEIEKQLLKLRYESGGLLLESVVEDDDGPINEMH